MVEAQGLALPTLVDVGVAGYGKGYDTEHQNDGG